MKTASPYLTTASLSKAAGVGRETLRFYETRGLIKPTSRTAAGYRQYATYTVDRIAFIKQTQLAGFTLQEIKQLLQLHADQTDTCGTLSKVLNNKLKQVDEQIVAMQTQRAALLELASTCSQQSAARQCEFVSKGPGCC